MALQSRLYAKENRRLVKNGEGIDLIFLFLLLLLLGVGLVMLYSASYAQSHYDTGYAVSTRYLQKQQQQHQKDPIHSFLLPGRGKPVLFGIQTALHCHRSSFT